MNATLLLLWCVPISSFSSRRLDEQGADVNLSCLQSTSGRMCFHSSLHVWLLSVSQGSTSVPPPSSQLTNPIAAVGQAAVSTLAPNQPTAPPSPATIARRALEMSRANSMKYDASRAAPIPPTSLAAVTSASSTISTASADSSDGMTAGTGVLSYVYFVRWQFGTIVSMSVC